MPNGDILKATYFLGTKKKSLKKIYERNMKKKILKEAYLLFSVFSECSITFSTDTSCIGGNLAQEGNMNPKVTTKGKSGLLTPTFIMPRWLKEKDW